MRISARKITAETYVPTHTEHTLDRVPELYPLTTPPSKTSSGLGDLGRFPNEIIDLILVHMDLAGLIHFQSINQQTFDAVASVPTFQLLCAQLPHAIPAILSIGTGKWISCQQLYDKFCTAECEQCGDFSGYLYVLGPVRRVCFYCFTNAKAYCPLTPAEAWQEFGLSAHELSTVPRMRSVPGYYAEDPSSNDHIADMVVSARPILCKATFTLLDREAIRQLAVLFHANRSAEFLTAERRDFPRQTPMIGTAQADIVTGEHQENGNAAAGVSRTRWQRIGSVFALGYEPPDWRLHNVRRWMGVIKAPFYNEHDKRTEEGFCCRACNNLVGRETYWRRKFNNARWREHIEALGEIVDGKHVSSVAEEEEEEEEGEDEGEGEDEEGEDENEPIRRIELVNEED